MLPVRDSIASASSVTLVTASLSPFSSSVKAIPAFFLFNLSEADNDLEPPRNKIDKRIHSVHFDSFFYDNFIHLVVAMLRLRSHFHACTVELAYSMLFRRMVHLLRLLIQFFWADFHRLV